MGMGQKAVKSDKSVGFHERRERLLLNLPLYGFKIAAAGRASGYSDSYANHKLAPVIKKDVEFRRRIEALREQDCASQDDMTKCVDVKLRNILDDMTIPVSTKLKAIELYFRRNGLLTDRSVGETADRERELTEATRVAARRLSIVLMREQSDKKDGAA